MSDQPIENESDILRDDGNQLPADQNPEPGDASEASDAPNTGDDVRSGGLADPDALKPNED